MYPISDKRRFDTYLPSRKREYATVLSAARQNLRKLAQRKELKAIISKAPENAGESEVDSSLRRSRAVLIYFGASRMKRKAIISAMGANTGIA